MTWTERENIFAREVLNIDDIKELFNLDSRSTAGEILRSIKRKLRIDGIELIIDLPGKIHRVDYLKWVGFDTSAQYGYAEKARRYVADVFDFPLPISGRAKEVSTYNPFVR